MGNEVQKYKGMAAAPRQPGLVEQWVSRVINFSSQYDAHRWSANTVEGEPRVYPKYGDIAGSWAQGNRDANQFIEVEFLQKLFIEKIDIYETYHAGAVKRVLAKHPNGSWYTVWQTQKVSVIKSSRIFSPSFDKLTFECNVLRIEIDCTKSGSWVEIDAIKIIGRKVPNNIDLPASLKPKPVRNPNNVEQWVSKVINYSSQYDTQSWSASCVEGQPKVYPKYGDIAGSWAQKTKDANQFIEVEYAEKIFIDKIDIYETYHSGAVKKIKAKRPNGAWFTVWETSRVFSQNCSRIFSPDFEKLSFQCNVLRIEVDCTASGSWVEIDAIKISGTKFNFDIPSPPSDITLDLAQLVNNPLYSDVRFDINGTIFYGHKAILSVRSEYCRAMFSFDDANRRPGQTPTQPSAPLHPSEKDLLVAASAPEYPPHTGLYDAPPSYESLSNMSDTKPVRPSRHVPSPFEYQASQQAPPVQLQDVDEKAFAVVLHYIYTNKLPPFCPSQILPTVWRTADRFSLDGLKSLAIFELSSILTIDNVVDIYVDVISSLPVIDNIKCLCESFMQGNMKDIVRHQTFKSLPQDMVVELIQMMTQVLDINK